MHIFNLRRTVLFVLLVMLPITAIAVAVYFPQ